jgi:hypothetical protein
MLQILMTGIVRGPATSGIRREITLHLYDFSIFRQALGIKRVRRYTTPKWCERRHHGGRNRDVISALGTEFV